MALVCIEVDVQIYTHKFIYRVDEYLKVGCMFGKIAIRDHIQFSIKNYILLYKDFCDDCVPSKLNVHIEATAMETEIHSKHGLRLKHVKIKFDVVI